MENNNKRPGGTFGLLLNPIDAEPVDVLYSISSYVSFEIESTRFLFLGGAVIGYSGPRQNKTMIQYLFY